VAGAGPSPAGPNRRTVPGPATGRLADDLNAGLAIATSRLVIALAPGDRLADGALARLADAARKRPSATVVYGDDDRLDRSGRHSAPWMKPDWNRELFLAADYVGRAVAFDRARAAAAGGWRNIPGAETFDLVLRLADGADEADILHVPRVVLHLDGEGVEAERASAPEGRRRAVAEALAEREPDAEATLDERGLVRVIRPLPSPAPRVSLLIPTRDRVDLLQPCVESLRERTDYPDLEIVVVDNGSTDPATLRYFRRLSRDERVRVLPYAGPFNFSAINNFAARQATGSVLGLVNNDIETIHPDWLREMVTQALRPEVGAVGAKLLYPSDLVQHAGVVDRIGRARRPRPPLLSGRAPGPDRPPPGAPVLRGGDGRLPPRGAGEVRGGRGPERGGLPRRLQRRGFLPQALRAGLQEPLHPLRPSLPQGVGVPRQRPLPPRDRPIPGRSREPETPLVRADRARSPLQPEPDAGGGGFLAELRIVERRRGRDDTTGRFACPSGHRRDRSVLSC
jgi:hypothetical protein